MKCGDFLKEMKELLRLHKSSIVVLIEPKISGVEADVPCRKLGKTRWCRSEAVGFSNGVWLLWDDPLVFLIIFARDHQSSKGSDLGVNCYLH